METIADRFRQVMENIQESTIASGREPDSVQLVVVTKTHPLEVIHQVIEAGASILGENRVQEAREKILSLGSVVSWHLVGHLQSNKAKEASKLFELIHSLDRYKLAVELDHFGEDLGHPVETLIQVNISGEETKSGISIREIPSLIEKISKLEYLQVRGLMTIPPFSFNPEDARPYFAQLYELAEKIKEHRHSNISMEHLSMGMSNDYQVAIQEGATLVRIGSAILGSRE